VRRTLPGGFYGLDWSAFPPIDFDKTAIALKYDAARSYRREVVRRWLEH
jgi:hypothetical protein